MTTFSPPSETELKRAKGETPKPHRMKEHWALVERIHGFLPINQECDRGTVRRFLSHLKTTQPDFYSVLETGSNQKIGNIHNKGRLIRLYNYFIKAGNGPLAIGSHSKLAKDEKAAERAPTENIAISLSSDRFINPKSWTATFRNTPNKPKGNDFNKLVDILVATREFVTSVGGIDKANAAINALELLKV